jgi:hypothetical protein
MHVVILGTESPLGTAIAQAFSDHDVVGYETGQYDDIDLRGASIYIHAPKADRMFAYSADPYDDRSNIDRTLIDAKIAGLAAWHRPKRVVYLSSKAAYTDSFRGLTFRVGEESFKRNSKVTILRMFDLTTDLGALKSMRQSVNFKEINCPFPPDLPLDMLAPEDAAKAVRLVTDAFRTPGLTADIGSGVLMTAEQYANEFLSANNLDKSVNFASRKKSYGPQRAADVGIMNRAGVLVTPLREVLGSE